MVRARRTPGSHNSIFVDDSDLRYFSLTNRPRPARDTPCPPRHPFVVIDQAGYTWMRRQRGDHFTPRRFASEASAQAAIRRALKNTSRQVENADVE